MTHRMVASCPRVAVLSSQVVEAENCPLVVLDLAASACLEVEEAFFHVEVLLAPAADCHPDLQTMRRYMTVT